MRWAWIGFSALAVGVYLLLFALAFVEERRALTGGGLEYGGYASGLSGENIDSGRKNYASFKQAVSPSDGAAAGDVQKYEKIATLGQRTAAFEADKARVEAAINAHRGLVQTERGSGLPGRRVLYLVIGAPPDQFDALLDALRAIGKATGVTIVKNDKTNEYLQLRAKRASLEKTRAAMQALQRTDGAINDLINVQNRLAEIEEKLQELGVSLGDFDTQNELSTLKLTLQEVAAPQHVSNLRVAMRAFRTASLIYAGLAFGYAALMAGFWMMLALVAGMRRMAAGKGA